MDHLLASVAAKYEAQVVEYERIKAKRDASAATSSHDVAPTPLTEDDRLAMDASHESANESTTVHVVPTDMAASLDAGNESASAHEPPTLPDASQESAEESATTHIAPTAMDAQPDSMEDDLMAAVAVKYEAAVAEYDRITAERDESTAPSSNDPSPTPLTEDVSLESVVESASVNEPPTAMNATLESAAESTAVDIAPTSMDAQSDVVAEVLQTHSMEDEFVASLAAKYDAAVADYDRIKGNGDASTATSSHDLTPTPMTEDASLESVVELAYVYEPPAAMDASRESAGESAAVDIAPTSMDAQSDVVAEVLQTHSTEDEFVASVAAKYVAVVADYDRIKVNRDASTTTSSHDVTPTPMTEDASLESVVDSACVYEPPTAMEASLESAGESANVHLAPTAMDAQPDLVAEVLQTHSTEDAFVASVAAKCDTAVADYDRIKANGDASTATSSHDVAPMPMTEDGSSPMVARRGWRVLSGRIWGAVKRSVSFLPGGLKRKRGSVGSRSGRKSITHRKRRQSIGSRLTPEKLNLENTIEIGQSLTNQVEVHESVENRLVEQATSLAEAQKSCGGASCLEAFTAPTDDTSFRGASCPEALTTPAGRSSLSPQKDDVVLEISCTDSIPERRDASDLSIRLFQTPEVCEQTSAPIIRSDLEAKGLQTKEKDMSPVLDSSQFVCASDVAESKLSEDDPVALARKCALDRIRSVFLQSVTAGTSPNGAAAATLLAVVHGTRPSEGPSEVEAVDNAKVEAGSVDSLCASAREEQQAPISVDSALVLTPTRVEPVCEATVCEQATLREEMVSPTSESHAQDFPLGCPPCLQEGRSPHLSMHSPARVDLQSEGLALSKTMDPVRSFSVLEQSMEHSTRPLEVPLDQAVELPASLVRCDNRETQVDSPPSRSPHERTMDSLDSESRDATIFDDVSQRHALVEFSTLAPSEKHPDELVEVRPAPKRRRGSGTSLELIVVPVACFSPESPSPSVSGRPVRNRIPTLDHSRHERIIYDRGIAVAVQLAPPMESKAGDSKKGAGRRNGEAQRELPLQLGDVEETLPSEPKTTVSPSRTPKRAKQATQKAVIRSANKIKKINAAKTSASPSSVTKLAQKRIQQAEGASSMGSNFDAMMRPVHVDTPNEGAQVQATITALKDVGKHRVQKHKKGSRRQTRHVGGAKDIIDPAFSDCIDQTTMQITGGDPSATLRCSSPSPAALRDEIRQLTPTPDAEMRSVTDPTVADDSSVQQSPPHFEKTAISVRLGPADDHIQLPKQHRSSDVSLWPAAAGVPRARKASPATKSATLQKIARPLYATSERPSVFDVVAHGRGVSSTASAVLVDQPGIDLRAERKRTAETEAERDQAFKEAERLRKELGMANERAARAEADKRASEEARLAGERKQVAKNTAAEKAAAAERKKLAEDADKRAAEEARIVAERQQVTKNKAAKKAEVAAERKKLAEETAAVAAEAKRLEEETKAAADQKTRLAAEAAALQDRSASRKRSPLLAKESVSNCDKRNPRQAQTEPRIKAGQRTPRAKVAVAEANSNQSKAQQHQSPGLFKTPAASRGPPAVSSCNSTSAISRASPYSMMAAIEAARLRALARPFADRHALT